MQKITKISLSVSMIVLMGGCAGSTALNVGENPNNSEESATIVNDRPFSYDDYGMVLQTYVDDRGQVDYKALTANPQALERFNAALAYLSRDTYESWTEAEQIAFWINAYNSLTLQAIIANYPTQSIRDIPGVWKWLKFEVMGEEITLDEIEHQVLRKEFDEPRIHMGLVCASIGCPILRREPYVGGELNRQLDEQTRKFLALEQNFKIDRDQNKVHLSSIFKWFGDDFKNRYGGMEKFAGTEKEKAVLHFTSQYLDERNREYLVGGGYDIQYLDYDWSLNEQ
ncbi:MAG: DUF547 domain-containing protein [Limnospira sp.]